MKRGLAGPKIKKPNIKGLLIVRKRHGLMSKMNIS